MCEIGGVGTNIIFEQLNPHSCKTRLQRVRESEDVALVGPGRGNFPDYVKLPGKGELRTAPIIRSQAGIGNAKGLRSGIDGIGEINEIDGIGEMNEIDGIDGMLSRKEILAR